MSTRDITELTEKSKWLRSELFELVMQDKIGHFPSSSSIADVCVDLYYGGILKFDPKNPKWEDRDKLIISKGHAGMAIYPILADLGFVPKEELKKFAHPEGVLRFYPDATIPGCEAITGSLGHGLGIGAGFALAAKMDGRSSKSYVIVSDGELYEGSTFETAMFAADRNLDNLVAILDRNGCCIMGHTKDCVKQEPIEDKWKSFGWRTYNVNGHSHEEILGAFDHITNNSSYQPSIIISNSIKGKGVSYMENRPEWHNRMPTPEQAEQARRELNYTKNN